MTTSASRVSIGSAFTPTGLEDEIFEAAAATPEIIYGDLQQFTLKLYQWLEKLQKDNNITVDMINTYGTIHFQSICNPNRRLYYITTISDCSDSIKKILKYHGPGSIFMPNIYSIGDDLDILNNRYNKNKVKKLSDSIIDIEWIDREGKVIDLEQVNIEYILGQIDSYLVFIMAELNKDYFDDETILFSQKCINRLRNMCIMFYKTICDKNITKDWIKTDFQFPKEIKGE